MGGQTAHVVVSEEQLMAREFGGVLTCRQEHHCRKLAHLKSGEPEHVQRELHGIALPAPNFQEQVRVE
jgi:hypothetical protein